MKVAVSSTGKKIESAVSNVFGRAPYFIIADVEEGRIKEWKAVENINTERLGNVGVMSAQKIAEEGAELLVSGNVGPRASQVLEQFNIKTVKKTGVVKEVLKNL